MISVALIGHGKMGRRIEALAGQVDATVSAVFDTNPETRLKDLATAEVLQKVDALIDFSHPQQVEESVAVASQAGKPLVIGTTGWDIDRQKLADQCRLNKVAVLYGSNFSLGVQLFMKLARKAAGLYNHPLFDVALHETHHTQKVDAPSGTARTIAELMSSELQSKKGWRYGVDTRGHVQTEQLLVTSSRLGGVFGDHEIRIQSEWDDICIRHSARNRDGFAVGALKAAVWLRDQAPGFYQIEEVVEEVLQSS